MCIHVLNPFASSFWHCEDHRRSGRYSRTHTQIHAHLYMQSVHCRMALAAMFVCLVCSHFRLGRRGIWGPDRERAREGEQHIEKQSQTPMALTTHEKRTQARKRTHTHTHIHTCTRTSAHTHACIHTVFNTLNPSHAVGSRFLGGCQIERHVPAPLCRSGW